MNTPKVFEFAKEVGLETLALMDKIREWKLPVKSHMAELDENLRDEIRRRLAEETKPAAEVRKTAIKRAAKAVAKPAAKKEDKPAVTASKAQALAKATKATSSATKVAAPKTTKKTAAGPKVIRRKAGEIEAKLEAMNELNAEIEQQNLAAAQREQAGELATETTAQSSENVFSGPGPQTQTTTSELRPVPTTDTRVRPRNIVGRMDLRRVTPMGGHGGERPGFGGGAGGANAANRPPRPAQRPIRPGFVAPPPPMEVFEKESDEDVIARKEREEKKRRGLGREEEEIKTFASTEFRKREVIFQPKKKKVNLGRDTKKTMITTPKASKRIVKMYGTIKVEELAQQLNIKSAQLIKKLITSGVTANIHTDLDFDTVSLIVPEFGFEAQNLLKSETELLESNAFGNLNAEKEERPPVVTIMGHVDHGKTTLLDTIRKANVAKGEAGGITQHIGAYSVTLDSGKRITFLDTPGHEAFTAMRSRGAKVTDIVIIVVAADDGVMPQTAEAINHAKAAGVPIIVAVNKVDKPGATADRIKQQMTEFELVPEEWGGTTMFLPVSGLTGQGVPELLEAILLQAEVLELKANVQRSATGAVIESRMEKGRGPVATLLVQEGTLNVGDVIVAGVQTGKVRAMMDDNGKTVKAVTAGFPVEVSGLAGTPDAGDRFDVCASEEAALKIVDERKRVLQAEAAMAAKPTIEQLLAKVKRGDVKELSIVLKADVAGSLEAVKGLIEKSGNEEVKAKIIHSAVGGITESDVLLASTAGGVVLGFNVRPDGGAQSFSKEKGVEIKCYTIIYEMVDELKKLLGGLLSPEVKEIQQGRAEVRNVFNVPKFGTIAGCAIVEGKVARNHMLRLVRDGRIVYEGKVSSLKRFKDDAREVVAGYECGIGIENFNDLKVGDVIEAFTKESTAREI